MQYEHGMTMGEAFKWICARSVDVATSFSVAGVQ